MEKNNHDSVVNTLNKLIEINNDRIKGYQTAISEAKDSDLKSLFSKNVSQSEKFKNELLNLVHQYGGRPEQGTSASGKVYRAWMDAKAAVTGHDKKAIVSSCEFGEDAAKHAYEDAKKDFDDTQYPPQVKNVIDSEYMEIKKAHDEIKHLRDTLVS